MSESRKWPRRSILKAAAGVTAGTMLNRQSAWSQTSRASEPFPKINPQFMITPDQAWDWNMFKAQCGPTYAGSAGWKRFTDFLIAMLPQFGAVDLDHVAIPYDHY